MLPYSYLATQLQQISEEKTDNIVRQMTFSLAPTLD